MYDAKGFLKIKRERGDYRPVCERVKDYAEVFRLRNEKKSQDQGIRCMDCGTPFCHWGCPVGNYIPEWNQAMAAGRWKTAYRLLQSTNNLPEVTGRICPAPCEYSCVLGINDDPITIRENELAVIEHAFKAGYITARKPAERTHKKVVIIGSGPAGLACADQLNQAGHTVTVFERDEKIGGILRYGIPDFKLEKSVLDRRIALLKKEGIGFNVNTHVGVDYPLSRLEHTCDAMVLTGGSRLPRDLAIEGRTLKGIHFAMDYLMQSNKRVSGVKIPEKDLIDAGGKNVVVIGGGDTGSDCVGTAHRQGAHCVVQIEIMPRPSECRPQEQPWPHYPLVLKTSTSHEEGGTRQWSILTRKFIGENGQLKKLLAVRVEFTKDSKGCPLMKEIPGSEFEIDADLVLVALGFLHPEHTGLIHDLGIALDQRGNVKTAANFMTSKKGVFAAGDMRRGQSLVVWAVSEGRRAAHFVDEYLMGRSRLPII
ncbi:MAG: glutamate synthase subunit beta [Candidatus Omnitrophica bacterium]|nr:glutamate synthase subunit beta [Candidatus Omnitrophota bacterium]